MITEQSGPGWSSLPRKWQMGHDRREGLRARVLGTSERGHVTRKGLGKEEGRAYW